MTTPTQKALAEVRAAIEAGPTQGPWHSPGIGEIHAEDHRSVADVLFPADEDQAEQYVGNQKDADYIAACNPENIALILADRDAMEKRNQELLAVLVETFRCLQAAEDYDGNPITIFRSENQELAEYVCAAIQSTPQGATK